MGAVTWSVRVWFSRGGLWSRCWPVSPAGPSSSTLNPSYSPSNRAQRLPGQSQWWRIFCRHGEDWRMESVIALLTVKSKTAILCCLLALVLITSGDVGLLYRNLGSCWFLYCSSTLSSSATVPIASHIQDMFYDFILHVLHIHPRLSLCTKPLPAMWRPSCCSAGEFDALYFPSWPDVSRYWDVCAVKGAVHPKFKCQSLSAPPCWWKFRRSFLVHQTLWSSTALQHSPKQLKNLRTCVKM